MAERSGGIISGASRIISDFAAGALGINRNPQPVNPAANPAGNNLLPNPDAPGSDGTIKAIPPKAEGEKSPMENYKDLFIVGEKDGAKPKLAPELKVDPAKLAEIYKKQDFTKSISPEAQEAAKGGDFTKLINEVAQTTALQSALTTTEIVNGALKQQEENFNTKVLPAALSAKAIKDSLRGDSEFYNSPAVSPVLSMLEDRLTSKFPGASAQEITAKAKEYLADFTDGVVKASGKVIMDAPAAEGGKGKQNKDTVWDDWADQQPAAQN